MIAREDGFFTSAGITADRLPRDQDSDIISGKTGKTNSDLCSCVLGLFGGYLLDGNGACHLIGFGKQCEKT